MNKAKASSGSQGASCSRRSFSYASKVDSSPVVAVKIDSHVAIEVNTIPSSVVNFRQMVIAAAKMQEYIANGGQKGESGEVKYIELSGLFNSPRKG